MRRVLRVLIAVSLSCASRAGAVDGSSIIDTITGGGNGDGFPASVASVQQPDGVTVGPDGSIYIAESSQQRVRRIDPQSGFIETVAGIGGQGFSGDGGSALQARFSYPSSAAADTAGNLYICDQSNHRIRRVAPNGTVTTVAGSATSGFADGPALSAKFYFPRTISVDPAGNVLIAEPYNQRIRYLNVATGQVSTVAGTGVGGFVDNVPATQGKLQLPTGVWSLGTNTFLIADQGNNRIRKVANGNISTVAGNGTAGYSGDGGAATSAKLSSPIAAAGLSNGAIVIADQGNSRVRVVNTSGNISTVAGTGVAGYNGDAIQGQQAQVNRPSSVAYNGQSDCLIADFDNNRIRLLDNCGATGLISTLAGVAVGFTGDGWPALAGQLKSPADVVEDASGALYIADSGFNRIRRIRADGVIETFAGTGVAGFSGDGGAASAAQFRQPNRVEFDRQGNLLVLDTGNKRLRRINMSNKTITTIAGTGVHGSTGDGGPASNATFMYPIGLAVDGLGQIFIADGSARRVRKIDTLGQISTIAGTGVPTGSIDGPGGNRADDLGDNGAATAATMISPTDVRVDLLGNVYFADMTAHLVRKIDTLGIMRAVAGTGIGTGLIDGPNSGDATDNLGDGGPAVNASLYAPAGLEIDFNGDLVIADQNNRRLRVIHNGVINTISGNGVVTDSLDGPGGNASDDLGDGGAASRATFTAPNSVFMDSQGNLIVADMQADRVRTLWSGGTNPPPTATFTFTRTPIPNTSTPIPPTSTPPSTITQTPSRTPTATRTNTPGAVSLSGNVRYYSSALDVPSVNVELDGPIDQTVRTNSSGDYGVSNVPWGTWNVSPSKNGGFGSAISSLDAARVLQVVAGLTSFSPLQRLACDVTGDGTISALDATRILQFSAGIITRLPVGTLCQSDWVFHPEPAQMQNQQVVDPAVGGGSCALGNIVIDPLMGQAANQNFDAVLFGDCTGNWSPASGGALRQRATGSTTVEAGKLRRAPGGRYLLPIYVHGGAPFNSLDLTVTFNQNALSVRSADGRGAAADALLSVSRGEPGLVSISLASATAIPANGAVLVIEFSGRGSAGDAGVRLTDAELDEQPARTATR